MMRRALLVLAAATVLAACSKEKDVDLPAELVDFEPTLRVQRVWSTSMGGAEPTLRLGLGIASDGERVFAAGRGGDVAAFVAATGKAAWRVKTKAPLSGGPGYGDGLVVVGSSAGEVIALEAADGRERWRVKVGGEVLAAPAPAALAVVVRSVDGRLIGLSPQDGRELWREEQQSPRLTLRGTATPAVVGDTAICGFDNGRVLAVAASNGEIVWDAAVSPPRGRTELERLVDIDAAIKVSGADVFVVGFQGRAAMLALDSGQVWWSRELSSYRGLDFDDDAVYVSGAQGDVIALRRRTGIETWRQDALKFRRLSAPAVFGGFVVVGDLEGTLHWLDRTSGAFVARTSAGDRISASPLVVGDTLVVVDDDGRLSAFRPAGAVERRGARADTPATESPSAAPPDSPTDSPPPPAR
jgi:outer membrane protein assembly factor BamB